MGIVILIVLMSVSAAYVIVELIDLPHRMNGALNFKPFNCNSCMSGWLSMLLWSYNGYPLLYIPFMACLVTTASVFLNNWLSKYL